jgi:hypothetical protein
MIAMGHRMHGAPSEGIGGRDTCADAADSALRPSFFLLTNLLLSIVFSATPGLGDATPMPELVL